MEDLTIRFCEVFGMKPQKAMETVKNATLKNRLVSIAENAGSNGGGDIGPLLYHLGSKMKMQHDKHSSLLAEYVASKKLDTTVKIDAALEYLLANINDWNEEDLKKQSGVGVVVSGDEIEEVVAECIAKHREEIVASRYRFNVGVILQQVRHRLKWADGKMVKSEVDLQILDILGPKTEEDLAPAVKKRDHDKKSDKKGEKMIAVPIQDALLMSDVLKNLHFHKPGENYKTDGYVVMESTKKLLAEHLAITGGKVRTRFPPEPNGILHIGHAKAININFGYAKVNEGVCFLRFDDTNPEKEKDEFFEQILDMVRWLGYEPFQITHSSDYFDRLYELAVLLIKKGLAYVCHQKQEEIKGFNPPPSPWRDRPVEENLKLFQYMRCGMMDEGEATLRMKLTLEEGKQDPVAYRVKFLPHPRTDKWCIYPTYDYTHCLCDSMEHITHSLCTKEFQSRRSAYYWLCNALDLYCPVQWEYGRLNMNYTVISKRKISKLIEERIVDGWDDPRLFTLAALRRRGFPSVAINRFCAKLGVTGAQTIVDPEMLEAEVCAVLNDTATRTMVVLEPLRILLLGCHPDRDIEVPDFPNEPHRGSHKIAFAKELFIEMDDFTEAPAQGYKRMTLTQSVGLKHTGLVLKVKECIYENGSVKDITCYAEPVGSDNKPKAFIHWVAKPQPVLVRRYGKLFHHKNPEDPNEVPGGFLSDLNENSLMEYSAMADASLRFGENLSYKAYQFERLGFFCVDPCTDAENLVFNHTVALRESGGKPRA